MKSDFTMMRYTDPPAIQIAEYRHRIAYYVNAIAHEDPTDLYTIRSYKEHIARYKGRIRKLDPKATFAYTKRLVKEPCLICVFMQLYLDNKSPLFPKTQGYAPLMKLWVYLDRLEKVRAMYDLHIFPPAIQRKLSKKRSLLQRSIDQLVGISHLDPATKPPLFPIGRCKSTTLDFLGYIEGDPWFAGLCEAPPEARPSGIIASTNQKSPEGHEEIIVF